tara:strand:+ start:262 stop:993 length:732 start_codon:yes stop_codon:yes gene_type:complete
MQINKPLKIDMFEIGSFWKLHVDLNGYDNPIRKTLATQIARGRRFEIIQHEKYLEGQWMKVRLLEDGYKCWILVSEVFGVSVKKGSWKPILLDSTQIRRRLPKILSWIEKASFRSNKYMWGGTIAPDFDCSGLIQAAFSSENIWLPRDAYQQEEFCEKVEFDLNTLYGIIPGDLIFFGSKEKCNHVAIYKGNGSYWHSSGITNGSNGIGINSFGGKDKISTFYFSKIRSIGRVNSCHHETSMP